MNLTCTTGRLRPPSPKFMSGAKAPSFAYPLGYCDQIRRRPCAGKSHFSSRARRCVTVVTCHMLHSIFGADLVAAESPASPAPAANLMPSLPRTGDLATHAILLLARVFPDISLHFCSLPCRAGGCIHYLAIFRSLCRWVISSTLLCLC